MFAPLTAVESLDGRDDEPVVRSAAEHLFLEVAPSAEFAHFDERVVARKLCFPALGRLKDQFFAVGDDKHLFGIGGVFQESLGDGQEALRFACAGRQDSERALVAIGQSFAHRVNAFDLVWP